MGRMGCAVCGKVLGPFMYKYIGLCNQCRRRVAKTLNKPVARVDCTNLGDYAIGRNLTKSEIIAFFGEELK